MKTKQKKISYKLLVLWLSELQDALNTHLEWHKEQDEVFTDLGEGYKTYKAKFEPKQEIKHTCEDDDCPICYPTKPKQEEDYGPCFICGNPSNTTFVIGGQPCCDKHKWKPPTNTKEEQTRGNCPYCDAEMGITSSWGMSPEGWENARKAHKSHTHE
jgi:hypothetical protein